MGKAFAADRPKVAAAVAIAGSVGCVVWAALVFDASRISWLLAALCGAALLSNLLDASVDQSRTWFSGSFLSCMLAIGFLGPSAAFVVEFVSEFGAWSVERYRPTAMLANLSAGGVALLIAATVFDALRPVSDHGVGFYLLLGGMTCVVVLINLVGIAPLLAGLDRVRIKDRLPSLKPLLPAYALTIALTVAAANVYVRVGAGGVIFAIFGVIAFSYMARLIGEARERTRQYAALSWGVLSGLVRTLDIRDPRASRHSAAVASYARDVARAAGMSEHDAELAHTAGLLHDIGRFALSDRVMERGRPLTNEDWTAIRRHPELGADMLRDLGIYGPVAEIVHCHHERIDGRGYPRRLKAEDIPEIAKIVAVAEVYDTLTADDTYRTPISSFEALTELRRVAGSQLDAGYVETLAEVLAGRGVEYRHAREASFERELDLERRIGEAAST
jgi:putative nucleotidyltransferase with HDIG domain